MYKGYKWKVVSLFYRCVRWQRSLYCPPFSLVYYAHCNIAEQSRAPMGSLRFPFSLPQLPNPSRWPKPSSFLLAAAAVGAGIGFAVNVSRRSAADPSEPYRRPFVRPSPIWASVSLADAPPADTSVEPSTGASFPASLDGGRRLTGIGLRKTSVLGIKSINVYAFGNFPYCLVLYSVM